MDILFVIEAPGKAKSLESLLLKSGIEAKVQATKGHLMTMPDSLRPIGIDCRMREFTRLPRDPAVAMRLREEAKLVKHLYVATDADQEGDVIAWDVAEMLRDIHPSPLRVKLRGMDPQSVREAIAQAAPVSKEDAIAGRTRAIVDRMIGATFSSPEVAVGRVSTALLGLVDKTKPAVRRLRLVAPAKDRGAPWVAETDVKSPLDNAAAIRLSKLEFPTLDMSGSVPKVNAPAHMGDIMVEAGDKLGFSPKEASESMQRLYEAGRMSYPRANSRGVSDGVAKKIADIFRKAGYGAVKDANYKRKAEADVHDAPYPMGKVDPNLDPGKLGQDEAVRQVAVRGLIKSGIAASEQTAQAGTLEDFIKSQGFSAEVAKLVVGLHWRREQGPRVPGQERWPESGIVARRADTVLLEKSIEAGLGRPSTWARHIANFMGRELVNEELALTERGRQWIAGSPPQLLDPRVSSAIERACENRGPRLSSDPDREPWEVLAEAIVTALPKEIREPLIKGVVDEAPRPKFDPVSALALNENVVERLENEALPIYAPPE